MQHLYFKEFIVLQRGFDLPKREMCDGPYPVVGSTSIIGFHNEYKIEPPGVVTGRSGSLGFVQYIRERYWPHNTSLWVKDFKGNLPQYVYYFLKTLNLQRFNSGVGVPTLNRNDLDTFEISIHPINTQRKIAAILSAYDDLIENNLRRIKILEEMAQNLYTEWFVKFRFPGHEKVKIVDSPLGKIPEGWEIKTLNTFGVVVTGKTPSKARVDYYDTFMPFIKIPDMHNNLFITHTADALSELGASSQKEKTIPADSICVSCIGTAGLVGITTTSAQTNQQINSIVLKDLNYREFLYFAVLGLKEIINQYGANGVTMVNLNKGKFEKLTVLCPLDELLLAYHENIKPVFNEIRCLYYKNSNLRRSRDLLLPRLISGELDVSDLDIKTGDDE